METCSVTEVNWKCLEESYHSFLIIRRAGSLSCSNFQPCRPDCCLCLAVGLALFVHKVNIERVKEQMKI